MSLTSSLFAGVSGLSSQGNVLGVIGDNISNISTVGFKSGQTTFSSLVTGDASSGGIGSGADSQTRLTIDQQGLIQGTGVSTDIAVSGNGFFVVTDDADVLEDKEIFYTRAGSFRQDNKGNFVNAAGYSLLAYPLDSEGRLPGETGNENTKNSQLLDSLEVVNTRKISGTAFSTSKISLGINLNAGESILTGSGDAAEPISTLNEGAAATDILAITTGEIEEGDILNVALGNGTSFDFDYGGFAYSDDITANNIFGSATAAQKFTANAGAGVTHLVNGDSFTITTATSGTVTFTYSSSSASTAQGTFNSLATLSSAIDATAGLNSNITGNRIYMSPVDAREAMTLADGASGTMIATGAFVPSTATSMASTLVTSTNRYSTLSGLAALVNEQSDLTASIASASNDASVTITVNDPLETITFADGGANNGVLLTEFGLSGTQFNAIYDSTGVSGKNMASGDISPAFSRNIRVFDGLGTGHDVRVSFVKADNNTWLVEVYAANPDEITTTAANGQLATGTIIFNGDGSLQNVSAGLSQAISVTWTNDSVATDITLDLGTAGQPAGTANAAAIGLTDGLSQFNGSYNVQFAEQNGAGSGLLSSIEINEEGFVIANFTNGQSREVFKIPLASFPNVNGLSPKAGNVYKSSDASGEFSLNQSGDSGVGVFSVAALEGANTELADELTKMIVAQRAFQANTKIITTADELLEELNRI